MNETCWRPVAGHPELREDSLVSVRDLRIGDLLVSEPTVLRHALTQTRAQTWLVLTCVVVEERSKLQVQPADKHARVARISRNVISGWVIGKWRGRKWIQGSTSRMKEGGEILWVKHLSASKERFSFGREVVRSLARAT